MFDTEHSYDIGIVGLIPLVIALLADATPPGLASELLDYSKVSAAAIIFALFVWLITKHIPAREARAEKRQDAREAKVDERLKRVQDSFAEALKEQLQASKATAESSIAAINVVMEKYQLLSHSIDQNTEAIRAVERRLEGQRKP